MVRMICYNSSYIDKFPGSNDLSQENYQDDMLAVSLSFYSSYYSNISGSNDVSQADYQNDMLAVSLCHNSSLLYIYQIRSKSQVHV